MDTQTIIATVFVFIISAVTLFISLRSFMEKGFLFNNSWIWASTVQRKKLNKKPYYRQSAISFLIISAVFAANGVYMLTGHPAFMWISGIGIAAAIIYAIVSAVRIGRAQNRE